MRLRISCLLHMGFILSVSSTLSCRKEDHVADPCLGRSAELIGRWMCMSRPEQMSLAADSSYVIRYGPEDSSGGEWQYRRWASDGHIVFLAEYDTRLAPGPDSLTWMVYRLTCDSSDLTYPFSEPVGESYVRVR
jgi:hypothetical protein